MSGSALYLYPNNVKKTAVFELICIFWTRGQGQGGGDREGVGGKLFNEILHRGPFDAWLNLIESAS